MFDCNVVCNMKAGYCMLQLYVDLFPLMTKLAINVTCQSADMFTLQACVLSGLLFHLCFRHDQKTGNNLLIYSRISQNKLCAITGSFQNIVSLFAPCVTGYLTISWQDTRLFLGNCSVSHVTVWRQLLSRSLDLHNVFETTCSTQL